MKRRGGSRCRCGPGEQLFGGARLRSGAGNGFMAARLCSPRGPGLRGFLCQEGAVTWVGLVEVYGGGSSMGDPRSLTHTAPRQRDNTIWPAQRTGEKSGTSRRIARSEQQKQGVQCVLPESDTTLMVGRPRLKHGTCSGIGLAEKTNRAVAMGLNCCQFLVRSISRDDKDAAQWVNAPGAGLTVILVTPGTRALVHVDPDGRGWLLKVLRLTRSELAFDPSGSFPHGESSPRGPPSQ
ncbi:hypothetical protein SKAU_G00337010 [Synaphobranchus kaupii]|uniref:Uncharacterized protein n=1 Tax=Synaphobranchus kaupii TaxID=118154 RepID=A0A9Q1EMF8_SYNKA|nr:hypothetical protein SKAU_G00337010 [Synaphobranchus kaupii]